MGTGGFVGFVLDGTEKIVRSHADSYPSALGLTVLEWATRNRHPPDRVAARVRALRLLAGPDELSDADLDRLRAAAGDDEADPEELLEVSGPDDLLTAGVAVDGADSPLDSLFAEWGYLIDLDASTLEVYRGMRLEPHTTGRFAGRPAPGPYAPVALIATWPLAALPGPDGLLALDGAY